MKKCVFFILLLVTFIAIHILFFEDENCIDFWSFIPPFAFWFVLLVFYLSGGYGSALATHKAFKGEYVIDSETEEFDEMLRKKKEGEKYIPRLKKGNNTIDSETDLFDDMLKTMKEHQNTRSYKTDKKI